MNEVPVRLVPTKNLQQYKIVIKCSNCVALK